MKLAVVLLLVVSQLNVQVDSLMKAVSCEDNDVFQAVDVALTKYNNERSSSTQFILYRIITASLMESSEKTFVITYEIQESNCVIEDGKNWKECSYKDSAKKGECKATVNTQNGKEFNVIEQNCHIIPAHDVVVAVPGLCVGCFVPISTDSSDLEMILKHTLQHFNEKSEHEYLFALKEVLKASVQVVNGWNYKLQYSVVQTDCLKKDGPLSPECNAVSQGEIRICNNSIYVHHQMDINILSQTCDPGNNLVSSVTQKISTFSPELQEPLRLSLEKFNSENKNNFYFKISTITEAESWVGFDPRYTIGFIIRETECSKDKDQYSEQCPFKENGGMLDCKANVSVEETGTFNPTVHCKDHLQVTLVKRPPGFSPFRSAVMLPKTEELSPLSEPQTSDMTEQEEEQAPAKGQGLARGHGHQHRKGHKPGHGNKDHPGLGLGHKHGHGHSQGHGYGHKRKHGQGHKKHEQKDKKDHESWTNGYLEGNSPSSKPQEETQGPPPPLSPSPQEVTISPSDFQDSDLLAPDPTNPSADPITEKEKTGDEEITDDDLFPDILIQPKDPLFPLLPDFPEPPAPNCPGRPWKPVGETDPIMQNSQDKDFDLSEALELGKK